MRAGLGSSGGFERLHYLLERAWDGPELSYAFLKARSPPSAFHVAPLPLLCMTRKFDAQGPPQGPCTILISGLPQQP